MKGLEQYQSISVETKVMEASDHELITMLFDKVLESIFIAKVNIDNSAFDKKNDAINKAIEVVGGLREFLDLDQGGEVALRLEQLYEWSERTLFAANIENSKERLDQVDHVIRNIRDGWVSIESESKNQLNASDDASSTVSQDT